MNRGKKKNYLTTLHCPGAGGGGAVSKIATLKGGGLGVWRGQQVFSRDCQLETTGGANIEEAVDTSS